MIIAQIFGPYGSGRARHIQTANRVYLIGYMHLKRFSILFLFVFH